MNWIIEPFSIDFVIGLLSILLIKIVFAKVFVMQQQQHLRCCVFTIPKPLETIHLFLLNYYSIKKDEFVNRWMDVGWRFVVLPFIPIDSTKIPSLLLFKSETRRSMTNTITTRQLTIWAIVAGRRRYKWYNKRDEREKDEWRHGLMMRCKTAAIRE